MASDMVVTVLYAVEHNIIKAFARGGERSWGENYGACGPHSVQARAARGVVRARETGRTRRRTRDCLPSQPVDRRWRLHVGRDTAGGRLLQRWMPSVLHFVALEVDGRLAE